MAKMQKWTPFLLVSSVYGSCCCVWPSPAEKYDNQLLGHLMLTIKYCVQLDTSEHLRATYKNNKPILEQTDIGKHCTKWPQFN